MGTWDCAYFIYIREVGRAPRRARFWGDLTEYTSDQNKCLKSRNYDFFADYLKLP